MDFRQQQAAMCYPSHMVLSAMAETDVTTPQTVVLPLAMAYVPMQGWSQTYDPAVGLQRGTVFPELDLPWMVGGGTCK
ncbi:MAG: spore coat associated protein CotJA [Candidatus Fimivivens sp.]